MYQAYVEFELEPSTRILLSSDLIPLIFHEVMAMIIFVSSEIKCANVLLSGLTSGLTKAHSETEQF